MPEKPVLPLMRLVIQLLMAEKKKRYLLIPRNIMIIGKTRSKRKLSPGAWGRILSSTVQVKRIFVSVIPMKLVMLLFRFPSHASHAGNQLGVTVLWIWYLANTKKRVNGLVLSSN